MKRKSLIIFLIIPLLAFLWQTGCKTEEEVVTEAQYDITGAWQVTTTWTSLDATRAIPPGTYAITFEGSVTNGIFSTSNNETGTYLVIGTVVQWIFSYGSVYTGNFSDESTMAGEMVGSYGATGTWNATK
jgi:hypothetical protein